jgi:hypothetical protein
MRFKLLLGVFIIIAIIGLLIFSPQGRSFREKYLDQFIGPVTGFFKGITGRFVKQQPVNRTLDINLETDFNALIGQNFDVQNFNLEVELSYDSVVVGGQNMNVKEGKTIDFKTTGMSGTVQMLGDNKMKIIGESLSVDVNGIVLSPQSNKEKISFTLTGTPISLSLNNIEKDIMAFSSISGTLKFKDWPPLALENDNLNIQKFKGTILLDEDTLMITGKIEKASLNGVDLSLQA